MRRLQNLGQAFTFGIDLFGEVRQDRSIIDRVRRSLDVVGANRFNNLIVSAIGGFLGSTSSAEEAVRRSFELGVVAARGADYGGAIVLQASSAVWC